MKSIDHLPAEDQEYIKQLREEAKTNRTTAEELRAKIAERDELVTKANTKLDELTATATKFEELNTQHATLREQFERTLTEAEQHKLRLTQIDVATEKGLPLSLAPRLSGENEEELKADADKLLTVLGESRAHGGGNRLDRTPVLTDTKKDPKSALADIFRAQQEQKG